MIHQAEKNQVSLLACHMWHNCHLCRLCRGCIQWAVLVVSGSALLAG